MLVKNKIILRLSQNVRELTDFVKPVATYQLTRCKIPEDFKLPHHQYENFKPRICRGG
jgi:hypothetical protein